MKQQKKFCCILRDNTEVIGNAFEEGNFLKKLAELQF